MIPFKYGCSKIVRIIFAEKHFLTLEIFFEFYISKRFAGEEGRLLPPAFFRFAVAHDTLALG